MNVRETEASCTQPDASSYHACPASDVFRRLGSNPHGLSEAEARERLTVHGPNQLTQPSRRGPIARFLLQFHNVLIYVLLGAACVTAALGGWVDTGVIVGVVVINALIGFLQEGKAEKALQSIRNMLSLRATVVRANRRHEIAAEALVPGDIVLLASGDKVPADLRLFETRGLRVEEAALTGESVPVEKSTQPVEAGAAIGDRTCIAYSGTLIAHGQARGVVVATGDRTEIGRIGKLLEGVEALSTPLLRKLDTFGRWLSAVTVGFAAAMFAFGVLLRGYTMPDMFTAAVGLAVAAIPEGLPAVLTITLAIGVQRMAKRNAIIRRLPAVETLGSVTVICSDKTGTLTKNEMTVRRVVTTMNAIDVSGAGYEPEGGFSVNGVAIGAADLPVLTDLARVGLLCNEATLRELPGQWLMEGDPTEGALLTLALKVGLDTQLENERFSRVDVIPFESEHRFMATLHHDHRGHAHVFLKGAPEQVLAMCTVERDVSCDRTLSIDYWQHQLEVLAGQGHRVLALATRMLSDGKSELDFGDCEQGFTLLGLVGIIDPPREEAIAAVAKCRAAGIRVKMITGDHLVTARAIGAQLGIGDGVRALAGPDIESTNDSALQHAVAQVDVFARASPEHKLRLVKALQANGEIAAMTGDGVNDAPALRRADVGVAMGIKGTEAAKEAAEMVLADDNFASIAAAVEEGRTVFDNIKKAIVFILPTNGGEAGMILIAILFGLTLPITPVQILWVNMVTAVTLALSLSFEPTETAIMQRHPRDPQGPIISGFLIWRIALVSAFLFVGCTTLFSWELSRGVGLESARAAAVNALVFGELVYLFNCRHLTGYVLNVEGLIGNQYVLLAGTILLVLQIGFTYLPVSQKLFGVGPLDQAAWLRILLFVAWLFIVVEVEKTVLRHKRRKWRSAPSPA